MPRILLLRHAKAGQSGKGGGSDHERTLSAQGRNDAAAIGRVLAGRGEQVEAVLCSTASRARETWDGVKAALRNAPDPRFLRSLYDAGETYIEILRAEGGSAQAVLVVGHNPTMHQTALSLAAEAEGTQLGELASRFPTAALAILDFEGAWADLQPGAARLTAFLRPEGAEIA